MKLLKVLSLLALLVILSPLSQAGSAILYVSTTGIDNGTCGAQATPCLTIQHTYDMRAVAGDEIRVLPGTYNECVDAFPPSGPPKPVRIVADDASSVCKHPDPTLASTDQACQSDADCTTAPEICLRATVIDGTNVCDGNGNVPRSTVFLAGNGSSLEGFAIRRGGLSGVTGFGGVAISGNLIRSNASPEGAGIFFYSATCYYGDVDASLVNNDIVGNSAVESGGGMSVLARAFNQDLVVSPPCSLAGNSTVTIQGNNVSANTADSFEGGGIRIQTFTEVGRSAQVMVTQNLVDQNTITGAGGSYGYGGGLWASTFGYGDELIEITENTIVDNVATGDGGGVSAWIDALNDGRHTLRVNDNDISGNVSDGNGGGLDLLVNVVDLNPGQRLVSMANGNTLDNNFSAGFVGVGGGGGLLATLNSIRTSSSDVCMSLSGNTITNNAATFSGGGATLFSSANADPDFGQGIPGAPATSNIGFFHNLVANNQATNGSLSGAGGGVFALLQSTGEGSASADVVLATLADNTADLGGGGIEVESFTQLDVFMVEEGLAQLRVDGVIDADNASYGIGGPLPGTGGVLPGGTGRLEISAMQSDFFNNASGDFEATINGVLTQSGNRFDDPALDPVTYDAAFCERLGKPNPAALSDVNLDDLVSGVDILNLATAFGADACSARYDPFADLDGDGLVDGNDLAFVATNIGDACP